jgi:hypothetical protein
MYEYRTESQDNQPVQSYKEVGMLCIKEILGLYITSPSSLPQISCNTPVYLPVRVKMAPLTRQNVRFEHITTVQMKFMLFWDVVPYSFIDR